MYFIDNEYIISQEINLLTSGIMPEVGDIFSIPFSYTDTGVAFTVNTCGVSAFVLTNTTDITLTINALRDFTHQLSLHLTLSERSPKAVQKRSLPPTCKQTAPSASLARRTILRL